MHQLYFVKSPVPLLPTYRINPDANIDAQGMARSLDTICAYEFTCCLSCHTDPLPGGEARRLLQEAWGWTRDVRHAKAEPKAGSTPSA